MFTREDVGPRHTSRGIIQYTDEEKDAIVIEWNAIEAAQPAKDAALLIEDKIAAEGRTIIRQLAIDALTDRGEM